MDMSDWCQECGGSGEMFYMEDIPKECVFCGGSGVDQNNGDNYE